MRSTLTIPASITLYTRAVTDSNVLQLCEVNQQVRMSIAAPRKCIVLTSMYILLAGYPASLEPLLRCLPRSPFLPPCPLPPVRPSLSPSSEGGYKYLLIFSAVHEISRTFDFFVPLKHPPPPYFFPIFPAVHYISRTFYFFDTIKKPMGPPRMWWFNFV